MIDFRPFRGLRYNPSVAGDVRLAVAPPYDVISPEDRTRYLAAGPCNVVRLILPSERNLLDGTDAEAYRRAAATLAAWVKDHVLVEDLDDRFYAYEQSYVFQGQRVRRRGVIGALKLQAFSEGNVFPHEETLSGPKKDRFELMTACGANFSQVFALYPDEDGAGDRIAERMCRSAEPVTRAELGGEENALWAVSDPSLIKSFSETMARQKLFIADGHHRYETSLEYRDRMGHRHPGGGADFMTVACYSMKDPGLRILPTHRVVRSDQIRSISAWGGQDFDVARTPCADAESFVAALEKSPSSIGAYRKGEGFFLLALKSPAVMERAAPGKSAAWRALPVAVVEELILARLLGERRREAVAEGTLAYVKNAADAVKDVDDGLFTAAFILNPTPLESLKVIASGGERMPAKSTYFYPKLLSGLVMRLLH